MASAMPSDPPFARSRAAARIAHRLALSRRGHLVLPVEIVGIVAAIERDQGQVEVWRRIVRFVGDQLAEQRLDCRRSPEQNSSAPLAARMERDFGSSACALSAWTSASRQRPI